MQKPFVPFKSFQHDLKCFVYKVTKSKWKTKLVFNYYCIFVHPKNQMVLKAEVFLTFIAVTFKTPPFTEAYTTTKGISAGPTLSIDAFCFASFLFFQKLFHHGKIRFFFPWIQVFAHFHYTPWLLISILESIDLSPILRLSHSLFSIFILFSIIQAEIQSTSAQYHQTS